MWMSDRWGSCIRRFLAVSSSRRSFFVWLLSRDCVECAFAILVSRCAGKGRKQQPKKEMDKTGSGVRYPRPHYARVCICLRFRAPAASRSSDFRRIITIETRLAWVIESSLARHADNEAVTRNRRSSARINKPVEHLPTLTLPADRHVSMTLPAAYAAPHFDLTEGCPPKLSISIISLFTFINFIYSGLFILKLAKRSFLLSDLHNVFQSLIMGLDLIRFIWQLKWFLKYLLYIDNISS